MTERITVLRGTTLAAALAAVLVMGCRQASTAGMKPLGEAAPGPAGASANEAAAPIEPEANENTGAAEPTDIASQTRVVAYYFHRTMRCPTCLSIEEQAREAVDTGYSEALESGQLEWHAVNIEAPGNEHFEQDFELESSALVLVEMAGDEVLRWKNLTSVWELVEDPPAFQVYVWTELADFL